MGWHSVGGAIFSSRVLTLKGNFLSLEVPITHIAFPR